MTHALLAPSSAHRWVKCQGSITLSQGIDVDETEEAREGSAAHWVAEQILRSYQSDTGIYGQDHFVGKPAPNGVIVTDEMIDAAMTYVDEVLKVCQQHGLLSQLQIESMVQIPLVSKHCFGTPDSNIYHAQAKTLYLFDFKYGHGRVSAYENWQLLCYAIGILNDQGFQNDGTKIVMRVVQPRCYDGQGPVTEWDLTAVELRGYMNKLNYAAQVALSPTGGNCTTGEHCSNCPAASLCTALLNATSEIVDRTDLALPTISSNEALGYELTVLLRAEKLLKARREAKEVELEQRLRTGHLVPGWGLEPKYGNRQWLVPKQEVLAVASLLGLNLLAEPELLSPAKADQYCKKNNVDPAVISSYYGSAQSGVKLTFDDGSKAKHIFRERRI